MTPEKMAQRELKEKVTPEQVQEAFVQSRLNVKKFAALLHVAPSTVYQWLSGDRNMPRLTWEYLRLVTGTGKVLQVGDSWCVR